MGPDVLSLCDFGNLTFNSPRRILRNSHGLRIPASSFPPNSSSQPGRASVDEPRPSLLVYVSTRCIIGK